MPRRPGLRLLPLEDRLTPSGWIDTSFGSGGVADAGANMVVMPHGLAAGADGRVAVRSQMDPTTLAVNRLTPSGSPDPTFGGTGQVRLAVGHEEFDPAVGIAVAPDGSVVFVEDGPGVEEVVRLTAAGDLDPAFDGDGRAAIPGATFTLGYDGMVVDPGSWGKRIERVAVLPDGGVLGVGETSYFDGASDLLVLRLRPDGSPDTAFGPDGERTFAVTPEFRADELVPAADGSAVVVGHDQNFQAGDVVAVRLTPAGDLDPAYGSGGKTTVASKWGISTATAVAAPDGGLVVGVPGWKNGPFGTSAVVRLTAAGTFDESFGNDGIVELTDRILTSVAVLTDGRIMAVSEPAGGPFDLTLLTADGAADPGFGTAGVLDLGPLQLGQLDIIFRTPTAVALPGGRAAVAWNGWVNAHVAVFDPALTPPGQQSSPPPYVPPLDPPLNPPVLPDQPGSQGQPGEPGPVSPPFAPTTEVAYVFESDGRRVRVQEAATGAAVATLTPFEDSFTGAVSVVSADVDGDGLADLIVTPGAGGGGRVNVYRGADLAAGETDPSFSFLGIEDPSYRGGARAAFGDVNGDGVPDLVVTAGEGGGPRVAVYDGRGLEGGPPPKLLPDFFAFEPALRDGATVAAGDVTGDGIADLVLGAGLGGAPRVRVFDGRVLLSPDGAAPLADFYAGDPAARGGVRVALGRVGGTAELLTQAGGADVIRVYETTAVLAANPTCDHELDPADPALPPGVFVG